MNPHNFPIIFFSCCVSSCGSTLLISNMNPLQKKTGYAPDVWYVPDQGMGYTILDT